MKKIKDIQVSDTEFSENIKWAEAISIKNRLLQSYDWTVLSDSNVANLNEIILWRNLVRDCDKDNFSTSEEMISELEKLEKKCPNIIKTNSVKDINLYKDTLIKTIRFYFNTKCEYQIKSYYSNINLINERYEEVKLYNKSKELDKCHLIKSYCQIYNKTVDEAIQIFTDEKKRYYYYLIKSQTELEKEVQDVLECTDRKILKEKYKKYKLWISILMLNPVQK